VRTAVSIAAVAVVTGVIFGLKEVAPVLSLGGLYLFAVLPVAVWYGLGWAIAVSVGSMLAFNFFFLPPLHTLALTDSENWVALAVYLVTAVVVSELAAVARRRSMAAVEAEALRRSDAAKTAVLHAVSHDLRSPLTAIRAAGEGLESGPVHLDDADRAELLDTILLETARLERLVSNLLDLSRLEAGAGPQPELWSIDELLSRALEALGPDAGRVSVVAVGEAPPVRLDAAQLEHVLVNVLENALRLSSPADPVEVAVEPDGDEIRMRITDRGPGLAEEDLERIFEPFEHGSGRGTGLGLAIARGFAEANACRLWAESRPGSGATFVLVLPAVADPARLPG
ncbi:MAG TPA: ATP-binding protein, partial [Gaiellaceae bacterium]|nr:ATP-binding protein [Gaiellaceae bacterium]